MLVIGRLWLSKQRPLGQKGDMKMSNQPEKELRLGCVKATIWANETKVGIRHNVQLSRIYKDGEQWATTESFGRDDLPLVAKVADLAHMWILTQKREQTKQPKNDRSKRSQEVEMGM